MNLEFKLRPLALYATCMHRVATPFLLNYFGKEIDNYIYQLLDIVKKHMHESLDGYHQMRD